jgi:hypothetical protein
MQARAAASRVLCIATAALGFLAFWGVARFGSTWIPVGLVPFDDEGYLMISVKGVLAGKPLYDEVYSQYGPFYYLVQAAVHGLFALPVTHDVTRQLLLIDWLAATGLTAWLVLRLTGSGGWAIVTFLTVADSLYGFRVAPGHPQEIMVISLSAVVLLATALRTDRTQRAVPFAIGALAAAVALTKVNVGVFLVVGLALALLGTARRAAWSRRAFLASLVAAVVLPAVLMRDHLPAAMPNALAASLAIVACALAAWCLPRESGVAAQTLFRTAWAFAGTALAICALTLLRGTSLRGLVDGVLVWPSAFARSLWFLNPYPVGAVVAGVGSLLLCLALLVGLRRRPGPVLVIIIAVVRVLYGVLVLWGVCLYRPDELLWYGTPFVWLVLFPSDEQGAAGASAGRATLALVAALQSLTAYPVRGSQLNCATYLLVAVSAVCLADAVRRLVPEVVMRRVIGTVAAALAVAIAYRGFLPNLRPRVAPASTALGLPGSDRVLVSPQDAAKLRWITQSLRAHCDTFVTEPGLNSYYIWTGMDPPTGLNAGMWMVLLDERQQQRVVDALGRSPRPCVVRDLALTRTWTGVSPIPRAVLDARPLARHIDREFVPVSALGGLELMLPKNHDPGRFENYLLWGEAQLDGTRALRVPVELLVGGGERTVTAWFRTTAPGVILACQRSPALDVPATGSLPILYVDRDGRLAGGLAPIDRNVVVAARLVNDRAWHHTALVVGPGSQQLYLDGDLAGTLSRPAVPPAVGACQIGTGDTSGWPSAPAGWTGFRGAVADVGVTSGARSAEEIRGDHAAGRRSSGASS